MANDTPLPQQINEAKTENAFILGYCEKCIQMTNHSYDRETGDYACCKCKPEKPKTKRRNGYAKRL
jgi:hypothetical protein